MRDQEPIYRQAVSEAQDLRLNTQDSSEPTRIPNAEARAIASDLIQILIPTFAKYEILGSIRRGRPDVKDAEILFIPKFEQAKAALFEEAAEPRNLEYELATDLLLTGVLKHRLNKNGHKCFGPGFQRVLFKDFPIDLFGCLPGEQWGIHKLIRTGPADFNKAWVTSVLAERGGLMPPGMKQENWNLYDRGQKLEVPEEEDYFRLCGYEYIEPNRRGLDIPKALGGRKDA